MSSDAIDPNWIDPDDVPELDEVWFAKAEVRVGDRVVRKGGRPSQDKQLVSLRIDRTILDHFRAGGDGWQTRINDTLKRAIGG